MRDRAKLQLYPVRLAIGLELSIVELNSVVGDNSPRDPEPGNNVLPREALNLFLGDGG